MATAADLVIVDADNTTPITYALVSASGGDKSPAVWRSTAVGASAAQKPTFTVVARSNGTGTGRRVDMQFVYPYVVTGSDGIPRVQDKFISNVSAIVPLGMSDAALAHAAAQFCHIIPLPMPFLALTGGYAPT